MPSNSEAGSAILGGSFVRFLLGIAGSPAPAPLALNGPTMGNDIPIRYASARGTLCGYW